MKPSILFYTSLVFLASLSGCDSSSVESHLTVFEQSDSTQTATYEEGIAWWRELEDRSPYVCLQTFGTTDAGEPLHIAMLSADRNFSRENTMNKQKTIVLINNAIHPGEPDGVDASMLFARNLVSDPNFQDTYEQVLFMIIPFYNVGGALNRNCCSRANQNGPEEYGFRGNARNLDLNRDFAKSDSRNAQSFLQLFSAWDPDVYLETHVSNGADYPYTMTYLISHPDKLTPPMNVAMNQIFVEALTEHMKQEGDEMIPYVNVFGTSPDSGYAAFYDSPRYSTGFTALHQSFGLLTETHMLKPFATRVASTLRFMQGLGHTVAEQHEAIKVARHKARETLRLQDRFVLDWETDYDHPSSLLFKGYRAYYDTSAVTGSLQLYYDESNTWEKEIPYYDKLKPTKHVSAPSYYLVPLAWAEVMNRLDWNGVSYNVLDRDTNLEVSVYHIDQFETSERPYEGHYFHTSTRVQARSTVVSIRQNEYALVPSDQKAKRLLVEMLEPAALDSWFNWNLFDEVLQQKEWFSTYVFDPEAEMMLEDSATRKQFEVFVATHPNVQDNPRAQLYYLYQQSNHFERDRYMIYPVFRIERAP